MAFFETPRFPTNVSLNASGGPGYSTDVVEVNSGYENRNANWAIGRCAYDVSHGAKTPALMATLNAFFRNCKGRAHGFRFKDWLDYQVTTADGIVGVGGIGNGTPGPYQLAKTYTMGANVEVRDIKKPVTVGFACQRNGGAVGIGAGAGQIAIDYTTGLVTFVADVSSGATGITVGATTQVTLTTNPGTLVAGEKLYLKNFAGADAALVNNLAHTINSVTGVGPFVFTLATNTAGKTITLSTGSGLKYPQASDVLTWSGEFDVPCRFDIDQMKVNGESYNIYTWGNIPVIEIRI